MGNIGSTEILLIALVALLLFGAGRIADIGKGLGDMVNFKEPPNENAASTLLLAALLMMAVCFAFLAARHP